MEQQSSLTRGQITRSLRAFILASGIWGAWGQAVGIGTAVFTGFALYLGADGAFIAMFTSIAYVLALAQLFSPLLSTYLVDKKRFILGAGCCEILFRSLLIIIPFVFAPHLYLGALIGLVSLGLLCGYSLSPFYSTWVANTIPENIRARFTSQQTIVSTIVAMIAGILIGQFIHFFPKERELTAFIWVFSLGSACGWLGYLALSRAPFPSEASDPADSKPTLNNLFQPFKNRNFLRAVLFYGLWIFAMGVAGPLYSVFMLDNLNISYTEISIFNAIFMITSIGAYRVWAVLIDRFGSKPVLQILMIPAMITPFLWVFNRPDFYYLVPVALFFSGIFFPGIGIGITPLLYGLLPAGKQRTFYLASWSVSVNLLGALGPLTGSFLARYLQNVELSLVGFPIGNLQIIFAISAAARIIPLFILNGIQEAKSLSSRDLLSQMMRGNLLSYAYNAAVYNLATAEKRRAQAAYALGKSGNPLAIEQLIQALSDASPLVRSSAARALGETNSALATDSLIKELTDGESDIRSEAAESLGRLGHPGSIDPLVQALEDEDPRVRISALRGLANIDREEVRELLFWHFNSGLDAAIFPTLVDVLGELGDKRIVKPTLQRLGDFRSPAIRLQLLDSVCQALGAKGQFYRLLSYEDTRRTAEISRMLKRATSRLYKTSNLDVNSRAQLHRPCQRLVQAYDDDNIEWLLESIHQIVGIVRDGLSAPGQPPYEVLSVFIVILAINTFLQGPIDEDLHVGREIFLTVCLHRLAELIKELEV